MTHAITPSPLYAGWQRLLADEASRRPGPPLFPRDAAAKLGVSEGELLASACGGQGSVRLQGDPADLLSRLAGSEATVIVRNEAAIVERTCIWSHQGGAVLTGPGSRLDLDAVGIGLVLAVEQESGPAGFRRSLQFFDRSGRAICKCFGIDSAVLSEIRSAHTHADQGCVGIVQAGWRPASPPAAAEIQPGSAIDIALAEAAADGVPRHLRVGNGVATLEVTQRIQRVVPMHGFLNILDPGLDVHLRPELCSSQGRDATTGAQRYGVGHDGIAISRRDQA
ncbi:MAG: hypothetical protein J0M02_02350 [Planctomycetes bacterium]|nr:hypothetical protein [Planctomycetota bacterium]